jgi:alkanesulfonate monooxygenase SsuD/methylene tetrahydromethanopterin reductase-like flavin-dependent oxidoreductase (luciferase family)
VVTQNQRPTQSICDTEELTANRQTVGVIVDLQFSAATNDWPQLRAATLRAEAAGVDTIWVLDHFDGTLFQNGDRPMLEAFSWMTALAACTTRINVGSLVVNVANRHPEMTAHAASTVQRISGGRLRLGIGAGAAPGSSWAREHAERGIALHADLADRHQAVVHQIEVLRHRTPDVPVIVGVSSEQLARIAGTHADGVNVRLSSHNAERYIRAAREAAGGRPFEASGWCTPDDVDSRRLATRLGLERLILSTSDTFATA